MSNTHSLNDFHHFHLIGIGGIGISGLARFLLNEKKQVTGTNDVPSPKTLHALEEMGVDITYDTDTLPEADIYVFSEAWRSISPEILQKAEATGKPVVNYFEALGLAVNPYYLIAVSGTHGKTTTTAMLTDVFDKTGKDPTAIIGSLHSQTESNYRAGKSKYAIAEACEFRRDFLHLKPDVLLILNLEHEHVDYYKNLKSVQKAYSELIANVNEGGVIITDPTHPHIAPILKDVSVSVVDYTKYLDLSLPMKQPGMYNRYNAAAALAVAEHEKLPSDTARQAVSEFAGTWRRFEYKGEINGAPVYDDYAHHPTEVKAVLSGVRELYPDRRVLAVFQPHTYSRTKTLFTDFAKAFTDADEVIVAPIYAAREKKDESVSVRELAVKMLEYTPQAQYIETFPDIVNTIRERAGENDVVLIIGAGPITEVATELTK